MGKLFRLTDEEIKSIKSDNSLETFPEGGVFRDFESFQRRMKIEEDDEVSDFDNTLKKLAKPIFPKDIRRKKSVFITEKHKLLDHLMRIF